MKAWIITAAALLCATGAGAAATGEPCSASKITYGYHCDACRRTLKPHDMRDGLCKRCDGQPGKIEFCTKRFDLKFVSECRHKKKLDSPFRCCGKLWNRYTFSEDRARVIYTCRTCKATSGHRDVKHTESCDNPFGVDRSCEKSGRKPHVG